MPPNSKCVTTQICNALTSSKRTRHNESPFLLNGTAARRPPSISTPETIKKEISMAENPQVKGRAVPYLTVDGAIKAAEFYNKAFAAQTASIIPPYVKVRTMHAHPYSNS